MGLLERYNADHSPLDTAALDLIFSEYESERIPRPTAMVLSARKQGEGRVVDSVEGCLARNQSVRDFMNDDEGMRTNFKNMYENLRPGST